jgi:hypothetical protein
MIGDMYGDFSRLTFVPEKHYSAVLVQQGRVTLDADANEQTALTLGFLRRLAADVIGPYGAPIAGAGFEIEFDTSNPPKLTIGAGRYYVHGLLCEAEMPTSYFEQPEAFLDADEEADSLPDEPYVVYLRVWERHVSAVEDPSIREVALGENGPDTTARSKIVWQVRADAELGAGNPVGDDLDSAKQAWTKWEQEEIGADDTPSAPRPALQARAGEGPDEDLDPCVISPDARYRGLENQLYRVEIHRGGPAGDAAFKWSRDNGSAVFPIESLRGSEVTVVSLGRDRDLGLDVGDWVEILDDRSVLRAERHPLRKVERVEPLDRLVFLEDAPEGGVGVESALHPLLRRWDQEEGPVNLGYPRLDPDNGLLDVTEGEWLELEGGLQIQFAELQPARIYTPGDYWLIPARTATADVEWPREPGGGPAARPPTGIQYFYAPLAYVKGAQVEDMRSTFKPLTVP